MSATTAEGITEQEVRSTLARLLREELSWQGDLPQGELAEAFDSVGLLTLVVAIEDHFGISFDEFDEQAITTIDEVVALVLERVRVA